MEKEMKMTDQKTTAKTMTDTDMDAISGGPHFRTWDTTYYDYHGECDLILSKNDPSLQQTRG